MSGEGALPSPSLGEGPGLRAGLARRATGGTGVAVGGAGVRVTVGVSVGERGKAVTANVGVLAGKRAGVTVGVRVAVGITPHAVNIMILINPRPTRRIVTAL